MSLRNSLCADAESNALTVLDRAIEELIRAGWKPREIKREASASVDQAWAVMRPEPAPSLFDMTEAG